MRNLILMLLLLVAGSCYATNYTYHPNGTYTSSDNHDMVDYAERHLEESGYWNNPYDNRSWDTFSHTVEQYRNDTNLPAYREWMFSDYFIGFFDFLNKNKDNVEERDRFFEELKTQGTPTGSGYLALVGMCIIYGLIKRK